MRRRHRRKPGKPAETEKARIERAESVKRDLEADGFKVLGIQFWKKKKLSDALLKLIQPYAHEADSYDLYYALVGFASAAWNSSLVAEPERSKLIDDLLEITLKRGAPRQAKAELRSLIEELIQRKLKLFPNDRRYVATFELEDRGDSFYLSVASVISGGGKEK